MAVMGVGRPQDSRQDRQDSTGQSGQAGQLAGQLKLSYPYPWAPAEAPTHPRPAGRRHGRGLRPPLAATDKMTSGSYVQEAAAGGH